MSSRHEGGGRGRIRSRSQNWTRVDENQVLFSKIPLEKTWQDVRKFLVNEIRVFIIITYSVFKIERVHFKELL